jgi:hypothetical protein
MKRRWYAGGLTVLAGLILALASAGPALGIPTDPGDGGGGGGDGGGGDSDPCSGVTASLSLSTIVQGQVVRAQWSVDRPAGCFGNTSMLTGPGAPALVYGVGGSATFMPPSAGTFTYQVTAFTPGGALVVATQSVTVQSASSPDGSFQLVNHGSGKCLEIAPSVLNDYFADGLGVQQRTCDGNPAQRWFISTTRIDDLLADHLVNKYTLKCLDLKNGSTQDRAPLQQLTCSPDINSMGWIPGGTDLAPAARTFTNWVSEKCVDVTDGSPNDFVRLQQFHCIQNGQAQAFFRVP